MTKIIKIKDYDKSCTLYTEIRDTLIQRKNENDTNQPAVLYVHIPGTSTTKDTPFPTYKAINELNPKNESTPSTYIALEKLRAIPDYKKTAQRKIPFIKLQGVGADGWEYVPPVMCNTKTLNDEKLKSRWYNRIFNFSFGVSTSNTDLMTQDSELLAKVGGVVSGTGKKANTQRVVNTLFALEEDGALPAEIFLSGHSRGAVNCIRIANEIYRQFGSKITIHLCLTDPVPGHFKALWVDEDEKIIPPNVATFNCIYSQSDVNNILKSCFVAEDPKHLIFTNPQTIVTTYSVPGDHVGFFGNIPQCAIDGVTSAAYRITTAAVENIIDPKFIADDEDTHEPRKMIGDANSWKSEQSFFKRTPIYSWCSEPMRKAIQAFRKTFERGYSIENDKVKEMGPFFIPDGKTISDRKSIVKQMSHDRKNEQEKMQSAVSKKRNAIDTQQKKIISPTGLAEYYVVRQLYNDIIQQVSKISFGEVLPKCYQRVKVKDNHGKTITIVVNEYQAKQIAIIEHAFKAAGHNPLSHEWIRAINKLQKLASSCDINNVDFYLRITQEAKQLSKPQHPSLLQLEKIEKMIRQHDFKLYGGGTYYGNYKVAAPAAEILNLIDNFIIDHVRCNNDKIEDDFVNLKQELTQLLKNNIEDQRNVVDNGFLLFNLGKTDKSSIDLYKNLLTIIDAPIIEKAKSFVSAGL